MQKKIFQMKLLSLYTGIIAIIMIKVQLFSLKKLVTRRQLFFFFNIRLKKTNL